MKKYSIQDLIQAIDSSGKAKRFSSLTGTDLLLVWISLSTHLSSNLNFGRSTNIPGIGSFYVKEKKGSIFFLPARTFEKLPGFEANRSSLEGTGVVEKLNISGVTSLCAAAGSLITRDKVELGLKDLGNALLRAVIGGKNVHLVFNGVCHLIFSSTGVKSKIFDNAVLKVVFPKLDAAKSSTSISSVSDANNDLDSVLHQEVLGMSGSNTVTAISVALLDFSVATRVASKEPLAEDRKDTALEQKVGATVVEPLDSKHNYRSLDSYSVLNDPKSLPNEILEILVENCVEGVHNHAYSGDRMWSNVSCPICKQKRQIATNETRETIKMREKKEDQLFMRYTSEVNKEFFSMARDKQLEKMRIAIENAKYNQTKALEREDTKKREVVPAPVGDLFEDRKAPVKDGSQYAEGLRDQIVALHKRKQLEKQAEEFEDKLYNQEFVREVKEAKKKEHTDKLRKRDEQREGLEQQIKTQKDIKSKQDNDSTVGNCFAKDESMFKAAQREKARQIYQDQLAAVIKKRDVEQRFKCMETAYNIARSSLSRKLLETDLKKIRSSQREQRVSLESYWNQQINTKKNEEKETN